MCQQPRARNARTYKWAQAPVRWSRGVIFCRNCGRKWLKMSIKLRFLPIFLFKTPDFRSILLQNTRPWAEQLKTNECPGPGQRHLIYQRISDRRSDRGDRGAFLETNGRGAMNIIKRESFNLQNIDMWRWCVNTEIVTRYSRCFEFLGDQCEAFI